MDWILIIVCLRKTNMSISDIKKYIKLSMQGDVSLEERLNIFRKHQVKVKKRLEELQKNILKINYKVSYYEEALKMGKETEEDKRRCSKKIKEF